MNALTDPTPSPSGVAATVPQTVAPSGVPALPNGHPGFLPVPASAATRSIPAVLPRPDHLVWHTIAAVSAFLIVVTAAVGIAVIV